MTDPNLPAWWQGKPQGQRQNRRSRSMERKVAREVGGRTTPGSGSSWRAPGDVRSDTHMIEHKYTDKRSFSVKVSDWDQLAKDALQSGKSPAMVVEFPERGLRLLVTEYVTSSDEGE